MKNYILSYNQINESNELENLSFEEVERLVDLGLLDPDLLKIYNYVKHGSTGTLDLAYSRLTYLPNWLTKVDGDLVIINSEILDIPDTLIISEDIFAQYSKLKEFRKTEVFGRLGLSRTKITKLPDGLIIHKDLYIRYINFEKIPKDLEIFGDLFIENSNLLQFTNEELREMYKIGGYIYRI